MRRRAGIAGLQAAQQRQAALKAAGAAMDSELTAAMHQQLDTFRKSLETFALRHKQEIQHDPAFRAKFHQMCATVGVDPLTSSKGSWMSALGAGDYYFELAVRTVDVCIATRVLNGGVLDIDECRERLQQRRFTYTEHISVDDIERAIRKLRVLQGGFDVIKLGNVSVIKSVPLEFSPDQTRVLQLAAARSRSAANAKEKSSGLEGALSVAVVAKELSWTESRAHDTLMMLLNAEVAWLDAQASPLPLYWFLGLIRGAASASSSPKI
mmetsp:Transcript_2386/g.6456  ORF Transcript_2386/g.6456 Transcript_2386/m.6456 type:complete len:267 (-) Transcript_2386:525-1325(-)